MGLQISQRVVGLVALSVLPFIFVVALTISLCVTLIELLRGVFTPKPGFQCRPFSTFGMSCMAGVWYFNTVILTSYLASVCWIFADEPSIQVFLTLGLVTYYSLPFLLDFLPRSPACLGLDKWCLRSLDLGETWFTHPPEYVFEDPQMGWGKFPLKNLLFASHPHGVLAVTNMFTAMRLVCWSPDNTLGLVVAPLMKWTFPTNYLLHSLVGTFSVSASKFEFVSQMKAGMNLFLLPGGTQEANLTETQREILYLKPGFIKYCLQHNYNVVPIFHFGESSLYQPLRIPTQKPPSFPAVLPWKGDSWFPMFPDREQPLKTVFGKQIDLPHLSDPTNEEVTRYYSQYVEALKALYGRHSQGKPLIIQ